MLTKHKQAYSDHDVPMGVCSEGMFDDSWHAVATKKCPQYKAYRN